MILACRAVAPQHCHTETGRVDRAPRSRYASPCHGIRKHTRGHSDPATHGRGLSPATAGALAGSGAGGQPPPLGVEHPRLTPVRRALPRPASPSPPWILWPCATRFRALHTGGVVCAIPDLRAVGSALLRSRLRAVGLFGRAGRRPTPPSSMAAPSHTPPRHASAASRPRKAHARVVTKVCLSAQRSADRSVQPRSHGHCAAGLPPHCAGLPGDVLAPHRRGNALDQALRLASPHRPPRGTAVSTGSAALCPCHDFLSPPVPLVRRLRQSLRSWRSTAVSLCLLLKAARTASVSYGLFSFLARLRNVMPEGSCVKARPLAEVGPRLGRARTVGLDVSAMVPRTWTPQQMECAAHHGRPSRCHCGRLWRDGILGCQAQRCSVTAQPGGGTLHPLSTIRGCACADP